MITCLIFRNYPVTSHISITIKWNFELTSKKTLWKSKWSKDVCDILRFQWNYFFWFKLLRAEQSTMFLVKTWFETHRYKCKFYTKWACVFHYIESQAGTSCTGLWSQTVPILSKTATYLTHQCFEIYITLWLQID